MATPLGKDALEVPVDVLDWVEKLHGVVDELVRPIVATHGARLACRAGCHDCCTDGLSVFAIEAAVIARHHPELLAEGTPAPEGGCAFLDDAGECRVYAHRPYVCRTQGLPLRWLERDEDDTPCEVRDICPKSASNFPRSGMFEAESRGARGAEPLERENGPALEELATDDCWTLGPFEERLATRQTALDGGKGDRVALRDLFAATDAPTRRHLPVTRL